MLKSFDTLSIYIDKIPGQEKIWTLLRKIHNGAVGNKIVITVFQ